LLGLGLYIGFTWFELVFLSGVGNGPV
jgi:hypothetical protein